MDAKIIAGILAAGGAALAAGGVYRMNKKTGYFKKGNSVRYDVSRIPFKKTSPLKGKTVVFLGSSVTKGFAAHNNAFAEYIAKKDSCICIKEAVNGTTLIDNCEDSYIERMRDNLDPERRWICLSASFPRTMQRATARSAKFRNPVIWTASMSKPSAVRSSTSLRMQKKRGTAGSCSTLTHSMIPIRTQRWWKHF